MLLRRLLLPALASLALVACKGASKGELKVAAASDLSSAFKEVAAAYEKSTGQAVSLTFGSTGLLSQQIANGAPFDVFAAANVSYVDQVVDNGACFGDSKAVYARGHLVLYTADGDAPKRLEDLADPKYKKIAIANPDHAPYGKAAKQALEKAGVWAAVEPKLVLGENIQQTFQFAQTGNAEVAIVALSLAKVTKGSYTDIPTELHAPIDQALVVCKGGAVEARESPNAKEGSPARKFTAFVNSVEGRTIMKRYGFLLPSESLADVK